MMAHLYIFLYIISFFSGVICLSVVMIYKNQLPKIFGIDFKLLRNFIIVFFCFFAVNFIIFYNEYFIYSILVKYIMLGTFDVLLVMAGYYIIRLNCIEIEDIAVKVYLTAGIIYIIMWISVYAFDYNWFPPMRAITQFIADAIFVSAISAILIICSIYQNKKNSDIMEKKYLIALNVIMCVYACVLYCADLFTELSRAYISTDVEYPYLYDPIFIFFIIVNVYTTLYLVINVRQIKMPNHTGKCEDEKRVKESELIDILSDREKEVIDCIVKGMNNAEIAEELCISVYTVKRHINNIFKKLEMKNRFELLCKIQNEK